MLETLRRIIQEVNVAADITIGMELMVSRIQETMQTDVASVYLFDSKEGRYHLMASEGLNADAVGQVTLGFTEGLVGQVGIREEPINVENATKHPKYHYLKETGEERYLSFLGVPVIHYRKLLGVLVVQQRQARKFDESEEAFLITLSAQLAGVMAPFEVNSYVHHSGIDGQERRYRGVAAVPGIGVGQIAVFYPSTDLMAIPLKKSAEPQVEVARMRAALDAVKQDMQSLARKLVSSIGQEESDLFEVYVRMLDDSALGGEIIAHIELGYWAESSLAFVIKQHIQNFELIEDAYFRERAADVKDLGLRVLSQLERKTQRQRQYPERTVLLGEEITATMLAEVPRDKLVAVVSVKGSVNAHMSIVARSMGIPTVVGVMNLRPSKLESEPVVVDGYSGEVIVHPNATVLKEYQRALTQEQDREADLQSMRGQPSITTDGVAIELAVNTGMVPESPDRLGELGACGVGLYRSEVPFMVRDRFPSEEEQAAIYREHLSAFLPHTVTMRTLDIGGDKRLPYFPIYEDNPFLGWRGIRVTLDHPEILLVQLRAMLKASVGNNNLRILLPMISTVFEVEEALRFIHQAYMELREEGYDIVMPPVGVMLEVPAAIYQTRELASRVDFLAVGSNDLAQYLLAVDRNNPRVAELYTTYHPAVLRALKAVQEEAASVGTPVSVCGEMAGDPAAAILLIAMGYTRLSMNVSSLLKVKSAIRHVSMSDARSLLSTVLRMDNAQVIHSYLNLTLAKRGLAGLYRPGTVL